MSHTLRMGGVERNTINLANELVAQGHEVHVLSLKDFVELRPEPAVQLHVVDFDRINRFTVIGLVYDLVTRALLATTIRKSGFVWRGWYGGFYFGLFLRRLERRSGGPFDRIIVRGQGAFERIWSFRDPRLFQVVVSPPKSPSRDWRDRWFSRLLYGGRKLVCNSSGTRKALEEKLGAYNIEPALLTLITNPVPIDQVRRLADESAPVPAEPYIVHVARLSYQKNQSLLLRAYKASGVKEPLVIVGGGSDERKLRSLAMELGIAERVTFAGQQLNPYPWMKGAKLFVLSSIYEGLGLVMVEAMACGTCVVAVDCPGGVRDVLVEEQAQLIAEPTVEGLAQKMRDGLAQPVEVKAAWLRRFDAGQIARQFLSLEASHTQPDGVSLSGRKRGVTGATTEAGKTP